MRLDRIYTKTGDKGETRLANGKKVAKSDVRLEAYGTIDELNSFVGLLIDQLVGDKMEDMTIVRLEEIQHRLFDIGAELATPTDVLDPSKQPLVQSADIASLEKDIDRWNESLEPLKNFVVPGGYKGNSQAHICRTICRRAERAIARLHQHEPQRDDLLMFVNRLSDWFFVLARNLSSHFSCREVLWKQSPNR